MNSENRKDVKLRFEIMFDDLLFDLQASLRKAMKKKQVTGKELAKLANITPGSVSHFFADDANPTLEKVAKLFAALDDNIALASGSLHGEEVVRALKDLHPLEIRADKPERRLVFSATVPFSENSANRPFREKSANENWQLREYDLGSTEDGFDCEAA